MSWKVGRMGLESDVPSRVLNMHRSNRNNTAA